MIINYLPTQALSSFYYHLYGEKEFELRQGLNTYDFLGRTYAPDECRFWQPDPNSGNYHWLSPYTYCGGDPINFLDPDGRDLAVSCDNTMYKWILNLRIKSKKEKTAYNGPIVLGHEMVHAKLGKNQMGWWEIPFESGTVKCAGSEKYATHYENMLRAEHDLPLRTHYIIQKQDKTETRGGQLIDLKTRTSLFYKSDEYINGIQQPYKYYK